MRFLMLKKESENLKKLREIVNLLESQKDQFEVDGSISQYKELTEKIDSLIHAEFKNLELEKDNNHKLKCYESLFTSIVLLLEGVKHTI